MIRITKKISIVTDRVRSTRGNVFTLLPAAYVVRREVMFSLCPPFVGGGVPQPADGGGGIPNQLMGGGTPFPGLDWGVPHPRSGQGGVPHPADGVYPLPRSGWGGGGTPSQVWMGGTPSS